MPKNLGSNVLFTLTIAGLGYTIATTPPSGAPWSIFFAEPATLLQKANFLAVAYVWPGLLSFSSIAFFQLQNRLTASGMNKRAVFSVCMLASGAMLMGLRAVAMNPTSGPSYVVGMALAYTAMSRLYAVRIRTFAQRVRLPWPVWRGNHSAVQEIDEMAKLRMGSTQVSR